MKKIIKKTQSDLFYIFITGASSGIGKATAIELALEKKPLIICGRRKNLLKKVQEECLRLGSPDVKIFSYDIQGKDVGKIIQKFLNLHKNMKIKALISSAGLARGQELVQEAAHSDWEQMLNTNVRGLFLTTRALLKHLISSQGYIINLGSVAGRIVYEGGAVYCATKFAVRAFSDGLRMDLKGTGVRVTNIEPGMVNTDFSRVRLGSQQKADAVYKDMMPLSATDIAKNILWCLQQPAHVNIQELVIYPTDQASVGQVVRGEKSILNKQK